MCFIQAAHTQPHRTLKWAWNGPWNGSLIVETWDDNETEKTKYCKIDLSRPREEKTVTRMAIYRLYERKEFLFTLQPRVALLGDI